METENDDKEEKCSDKKRSDDRGQDRLKYGLFKRKPAS